MTGTCHYMICNVLSIENSWGVFNGFCSKKAKDANHGVLIAGYTKSKPIFKTFHRSSRFFSGTWIVKNSWGGSWGHDGYIEFAKGKNECGLANEPILAYFNN